MSQEIITSICGTIPEGFKKVIPGDSNYIFQNDPNFQPLNLYDFFGRAATVNSFTECYYYVELGFEPNKITIFDIGTSLFIVSLIAFTIYKLVKENFFSKFKNFFVSSKNIQLITKKRYVRNSFFTIFLLFQSFYIYDYIRTKSLRIPNFIDEYITLTSNVNFFKGLNFDAGQFIGGNYSVQITSGPISAIGSVIGWNLTNKLIVARMSNFLWIVILQTLFVYLILKVNNETSKYLYLTTPLIILLIPWWQGALYSIGEISSSILFINAIFLFQHYRKASLIIFSISIFYGKLLNLVPFFGFYIIILFYEKSLKNVIKDIGIFLLSLLPWLSLVNFRYENGNLFNYLQNQFLFITNHQSSGVLQESSGFFNDLINAINISEFANWNFYEKTRLIIVPLIFIIVLLRNKKKINIFFGNVTLPIVSSTIFIFLWFWILNSTKWMRHTQHFIVPMLITIIYLINFNVINKKIDYLLLLSIITYYIDNNKNFIFISLVLYFLIIFLSKNEKQLSITKYALLLILLIDISLPYHEKEISGNIHEIIEECQEELISDNCRESYLNN